MSDHTPQETAMTLFDAFDWRGPEEGNLPASPQEARASAGSQVGMSESVPAAARWRWWDHLGRAAPPEARQACQWVIDALGEAIGLSQPERARELVDANWEADRADSERRERELARWRP